MNVGRVVGTACGSFAITNIDDIFVLVAFFAEASTGKSTLTAPQVTVGQYVGFTVIIVVSMIGYGASLLFSAEPIGFLGLLPILLGIWWLLSLVAPRRREEEEAAEPLRSVEEGGASDDSPASPRPPEDAPPKRSTARTWVANNVKVSSVTVMNGADNISTYVPLFSQAAGAEIAVYVVIYYLLLGVWCAAAFLVMRQRHMLRLAERYARLVVPFLYLGLGIFIVVKSHCYPWSIAKIDHALPAATHHPGTAIMASATSALLAAAVGLMVWRKLRARAAAQQPTEDDAVSAHTASEQPPALSEQPTLAGPTLSGPTLSEHPTLTGQPLAQDSGSEGLPEAAQAKAEA